MLKPVQENNDIVRNANLHVISSANVHPRKSRMLLSKGQVVSFNNDNEGMILLLISGEAVLRNTENHLIAADKSAPAVLGLPAMYKPYKYHFLQTVTDAEITMLPLSDFIDMANRGNLWQYISAILSHALFSSYSRVSLLSSSDVYSMIRQELECLWDQGSGKSEGVSVFNFILNRTPVSRSSLNKILKELTSGGYITVKRGKLTNLNKLPARF